MIKVESKIYSKIFLIFSVFLILCFFHLAQSCYFADSEIWLLTLSQNLFNHQHLTSIAYKFSFHTLTYLFSHHSPSELDVYFYARTGWSIVALGTQILLAYFYASAVGQKNFFFPLFISLMTFSAFFNQGFRIRGDILALGSHTLVLLLLLKMKHQQITQRHYFLLFIINSIMLTSTPKAIYFYISQFLFAWILCKNSKYKKSFLRWIWIAHLIPIHLVLTLVLFTFMFPEPFNLITPLHEALDFYLKSFDPSLKNFDFLSLHDFVHVLKAFLLSPTHAVLFLIGFSLYFFESYRKNNALSHLNVLFGVSLLFLILHNQKLPFFIGTFGAPLVAYTSLITFLYIKKIFNRFADVVLLIIAFSQIFWACLQYTDNLQKNHNLAQSLAIQTFDNYVTAYPELTFFDIIGVLPRKADLFLFVGPGETIRKKQIVTDLENQNPDILLFTYKFNFLEPDIANYLIKNRISPEPHIWIKGDFFSVSQTPQYFRQTRQINNEFYWVIPTKPKKFIYLGNEDYPQSSVVYLKNDKPTPKRSDADRFAIPQKYLSALQTDNPPLFLYHSPFTVFRYDTQF